MTSTIKTYSGQYHIVTMHDDTRHYVPVAEIDLAEIADDYASVDTVTGYLCRHDGGDWTPVDAESQDDARQPRIQAHDALVARVRDKYAALVWAEYDSAAEWCAARGLNGEIGDPLPESLSVAAFAEINADPEAFAERVRACAYARAMAKRDPEE